MAITFYLARHGESFGNIGGDITGSNPELTPLGWRQADTLAKKFSHIPLTAVYASTLIRSQQTAMAIASAKNIPLQITAALNERHFGSLEGVSGLQVQALHGEKYRAFSNAPLTEQLNWKLVADEETFGEVIGRMLDFFDGFDDEQPNQQVLLVSHANVLVPLLVHLGFATFSEIPKGSVTNTGFIKIIKDVAGNRIVGVDGISKE